ncbi:hypothetical protein V8G54_000123 (mitochondrion) [Vigna mungo]|uniref:Pentatricopeptide repeat-containing protein n=1 Tax=Vigna mungo TaxID=3915 RepID=A0AAQ3PKE5_VIGMU
MLQFGIFPNEYCFTASIRSSSNAQYFSIGLVIFGFLCKTGYFHSHVFVGCALIDMFAKGNGDIHLARMVFDKMQDKNLVTWTLMITRYAQHGFLSDAIYLFCSLLVSEHTHDRFTLTSLLSATVEMGFFSLGKQLHSWVIRSRLASDVCVDCTLVDMYTKCAADGSHAIVGEHIVVEFIVGELIVGELIVGELIVGYLIMGDLVKGELIIGEVIVGELIVGDLIMGEFIVGELTVGELIVGCIYCLVNLSFGELIMDEVIVGELIVGDLIVGELIGGELIVGDLIVGEVNISWVILSWVNL